MARKLEQLPEVRKLVANCQLGYTKAREIVKVADARGRARRKVGANPRQTALVPVDETEKIPPAVVSVRLFVEMTPEQFAQYEALLEALHKRGPVSNRAELVLEAMGELVTARENSAGKKAPRGALAGGPLFQVHVHQCPDCGGASISTSKGELAVGKGFIKTLSCDAKVDRPGRRNTPTIPAAMRKMALARDRHRCRTAGCDHTKLLAVHHIQPRSAGGINRPENLITLCSTCHRLWHEKPESMAVMMTGA